MIPSYVSQHSGARRALRTGPPTEKARVGGTVAMLFAACVAAALSVSCGNRNAEVRADELAVAIRENQVQHFVRTFSTSANALAIDEARRRAHAPSLRDLMAADGLAFETDENVRELVLRWYQSRDFAPAFVSGTSLTENGRALADKLLSVHNEGFPAELFHLDRLRDDLAVVESASDVESLKTQLEIDEAEERRLLEFLLADTSLDSTVPAHDAVFAIISATGADNPIPDYAAAIDRLAGVLSNLQQSAPELELVLAAGFVRYGLLARHENLAWVSPETATARGWKLDDAAQRDEILDALVLESFERASTQGFDDELAHLTPRFDQYPKLVRALEQYREFAAQGPWPEVPGMPILRVGQTNEAVPTLRARLAAEGYFDGDLASTTFDADVSRALAVYQETHQLGGEGSINEETITSLNVPVERRIAQLRLALHKWRGSRSAAHLDRDFVWVNVPDFHAEIWDRDELVYRWRVVVGRERRVGTRVEGRTPLFSDLLQYIVFNPYWNVPRNIETAEYTALIEADPTWLATNGFEYYYDSGGTQWLRQVPGPGNALGQIKFLFPNNHFVYMHDTPLKSLFSRPTRAFSHGCVRVQDPLQLGSVLLQRDKDMTEGEADAFIRRQLEKSGEQWMSLEKPLPVHIEYISARVDEDGRAHFLADPYRYDRGFVDEYQAGRMPESVVEAQ